MTIEIIIQVILFSIALSMDAFCVSIAQGITFKDIDKKKSFFIAFIYGFFQGLFPLISFFIVEFIEKGVEASSSAKAINIFNTIIAWVSFAALLIIGIKMIIEGIKTRKNSDELLENNSKLFSVKEVLFMGVITAIDALSIGIVFHSVNETGYSISTSSTIFLHVSIIMVITFIICLVGTLLSIKLNKLFKGRYDLTNYLGGTILILLSIWTIMSHYLNI